MDGVPIRGRTFIGIRFELAKPSLTTAELSSALRRQTTNLSFLHHLSVRFACRQLASSGFDGDIEKQFARLERASFIPFLMFCKVFSLNLIIFASKGYDEYGRL